MFSLVRDWEPKPLAICWFLGFIGMSLYCLSVGKSTVALGLLVWPVVVFLLVVLPMILMVRNAEKK